MYLRHSSTGATLILFVDSFVGIHVLEAYSMKPSTRLFEVNIIWLISPVGHRRVTLAAISTCWRNRRWRMWRLRDFDLSLTNPLRLQLEFVLGHLSFICSSMMLFAAKYPWTSFVSLSVGTKPDRIGLWFSTPGPLLGLLAYCTGKPVAFSFVISGRRPLSLKALGQIKVWLDVAASTSWNRYWDRQVL